MLLMSEYRMRLDPASTAKQYQYCAFALTENPRGEPSGWQGGYTTRGADTTDGAAGELMSGGSERGEGGPSTASRYYGVAGGLTRSEALDG